MDTRDHLSTGMFLAWPLLYCLVRKARLHALHRRGVTWLQRCNSKLFLPCLLEHSSCACLECHRCVKDVSKAIVQHLAAKPIVFPSTEEELTRNAACFEQYAKGKHGYGTSGLPQVMGAADGTHIPIRYL